MSGVIPQTKYLLTSYNIVIDEFDSLVDIANHIGIIVLSTGNVLFNRKKIDHSYDMTQFSKKEIIQDFARNHMISFLKKSKQYKIYRFLI